MRIYRIAGLWIIGFFYTFAGASQTKTAALTTWVEEVKIYRTWQSVLNAESFPDYTTDSAFSHPLMNEARRLLREKLNVTTVHVSPPQFRISVQRGLPALPPPDSSAGFSVAIIGQIALQHIATDSNQTPVKNYQYTSLVQIWDARDSVVFNHRTVIPFRVAIRPGSAYGAPELSRDDRQSLILDGLRAALTESKNRLPQRTYYRPPLRPDTDFVRQATLFTLRQSAGNGAPRQTGEARNGVITVTNTDTGKNYAVRFTQRYLTSSANYTTYVTLTDEITQSNYEITASFTQDSTPKTTTPTVFLRCTADGLLVGDFTLTAQSFEGLIGYEVFTIRRAAQPNAYEIRINNRLGALVQSGNTQTAYAYLSRNATTATVGNAMMVWLMYRMGYEFGRDYALF